MTFDPSQLISCKSSTLSAVSNANGTPSAVVRKSFLYLSTSLHLDSDALTRKTIGCGTRRGKLYYLDWASNYEVKLADSVPNSVTEALENPKWKEDDIIVTGNDTEEQLKLQKYLSQEFEMKDLGDLKYFLGIEVARSKTSIFMCQRKYVIDLLTEIRMFGCKPADTSIEMNHKLCEDMDQEPTNKEQYQRLIGRLIYMAHTRPDIAYVMSVVSQFMHSPSVSHRNTVDRILRYLKLAPGKGLMFSKNGDLEVVGYRDADWDGSITDRSSTSCYFTFVEGNLVTWQSKKQNVVSRSSAEAEY
ncbi:PREDICTED: uncharacterized mitochondrial protein AtMg00810-like [Prunus mume]|uniref:Uncharacterized mitochondrial protein AtMg00810-like n=1 Tax=Prunus mume TaxID=102107 RepID=A0ABM1LI93_PRUMU|nr:PREDICTED: uncharacterized mitochondrial protein AtMg00810-like [Prunus mume]